MSILMLFAFSKSILPVRTVMIDRNNAEIFFMFVRFTSSMESLSKG